MNQVLLSLIEKNGGKVVKLELFIYHFISVRCLLISILQGCNTVFQFQEKFVGIKVFAYVLFSSSCFNGEGLSQFVIKPLMGGGGLKRKRKP